MKLVVLIFTILLSNQVFSYDRLVSIGGSITEIIFALGEGKKIVGVDSTSVFPMEAKEKKQLGYRHSISLEGILSLKPDAIFTSEKYIDKKLLKKLKDLKLNVITIKEVDEISNVKVKIQTLAKALKKEEQGQQLISNFNKDMKVVENLKNKTPSKKLLFIYARGGNRVFLSGTKTAANTMIKLSGSKNGFDTIEGFKPITTESLIMTNPDGIIMLKSGVKSLKDGPWTIKGMAQTNAGKKKALIVVDDLAFLSFGPRTGKTLINLLKQIKGI